MTLSYQGALDFLYPRTTTIKFGLERTLALLEGLGRPDRIFPVIHVGGTNGKGSVCALVAGALEVAGWRVGLYTSPHLVSFRERFRVNGQPISEAAVAMWVEQMRTPMEALDATFFEATTALAFADFAARGVEIAVIEVGLGGRLDSTNVVQPLVSAITKIELDHQRYLGETLELIAIEKAGIAKPGAPLVVGETRPELLRVLKAAADSTVAGQAPGQSADVRVVPAEVEWPGPLGLLGDHQRRNAAVAQAVLETLPAPYQVPADAVASAFASARVPGRLQRHGPWLFDVAHNPDGMQSLVQAIRALDLPRPVHALVSILGDKAWPEMLVTLDQAVDQGILTVAPSADARRWDLGWLEAWLADPDRPTATARWRLEPHFEQALKDAREGAGTVVVTGSFHTVGDVMAVLGLSPI